MSDLDKVAHDLDALLTKMLPTRQEQADRLEALCGLNPQAVGVGQKIDTSLMPFWRARAALAKEAGE